MSLRKKIVGLLEICVLLIGFISLLNLVILIFMSIFLVRLRDAVTQSTIDALSNLRNNIGNLTSKTTTESWDKKYEFDLEKINERLKSGSNLNDL